MDTVFYNGVIHTMAGRTVSALAVQNGRIALAGTDEAALALADTHTKKIDLGGRCVLPGFTDSHIHILQAGMVCHRLDLRGVTSLQEIIDRGQDYVKHADLAPGEWIIGYGFDHNRFDPPTLPDGATAEAKLEEHGFVPGGPPIARPSSWRAMMRTPSSPAASWTRTSTATSTASSVRPPWTRSSASAPARPKSRSLPASRRSGPSWLPLA